MESHISKFFLLGLSYAQHIRIFCFVLLIFSYVSILVGNLVILVSTSCSYLFNQPMYYFLGHLSCMDICYTSSVTPTLISDLLVVTKTISYGNSMLQVFTMHFFGGNEVLIIAAMAFDCYIAICKPLHYIIIMNRTTCNLLILAAWAGAALHSFPQFDLVLQLPFCGPDEIDHYFWDIFPLLKFACTDTYITGVLVVADSGMVASVTFVVLFVSYVIVLFTLRNHLVGGKCKALSTCGSHITVVVLFFSLSIFVYLRSPTAFPEDKIYALFYSIIAPMFNLLIHTLRNTEMKNVMRKVWCEMLFLKVVCN